MVCVGIKSISLLVDGQGEVERAQGLAVHLKPNMKDVEGNLSMTQRVTKIQNPINNDDPYEGTNPIFPHKTKYPVIYEPLRNIKFSRLTYKITSFLDFSPYVSFFERYEKYINDFLEDIQDSEKVEMIKNPTNIFKRHIDMLKYFPTELRNLTCDDPQVCAGHEDKFCYQWYVSTCMNRQHYEHMVEEVKYVKEVFEHVKETFFQAINHVSSHSGEADLTNDTPHSNHMTRTEAHYLKDEIATMAGRRDRKKRLVEWGAMVALGYGVYSNAEDIKTIEKKFKVLQNENKRQDRNINTLARYLRRTIYRVKLHDQMLLGLNIRLIRLEYNLMGHMHLANYNDFTTMILRDAGFTMSRLLTGLMMATQNAEAVYSYLRVMASHKLDPTIVPVP